MFSLFAAPPELDLDWSDQGVEGASRFLHRLWRLVHGVLPAIAGVEPYDGSIADLPPALQTLRRKTHLTIRKVTSDIEERFHFNTAISAVMELVNELKNHAERVGDDLVERRVIREAVETVILLLAPIVPHITAELWQRLGRETELANCALPVCDPESIKTDTVLLVVQVNGKVRDKLNVVPGTAKDVLESQALASPNVQKWMDGKQVRKVIVVPNKLVNIVVG
jgi:leucyl-tRNA synthetase